MKKLLYGGLLGLQILTSSPAKAQEQISQQTQKNITEILTTENDPQKIDSLKNDLFQKINDYRKANGLPVVKRSTTLDSAAQKFAQYMTQNKVRGHGYQGKSAEDMGVDLSGYEFFAENVSYNIQYSPDIITARSNSPNHNNTLLDKNTIQLPNGKIDTLHAEEIGIGIAGPNIVIEMGTKKKTEEEQYQTYLKENGPILSLAEQESKREIDNFLFSIKYNIHFTQHSIAYTILCYNKRNQSADQDEQKLLDKVFEKYSTTKEDFVQTLKENAKQYLTLSTTASITEILDYCLIASFLEDNNIGETIKMGLKKIDLETIKEELTIVKNYKPIPNKKPSKSVIKSKENLQKNIHGLYIYCKLQQINKTPDQEAEVLLNEMSKKSKNYQYIIGL